MKILVTGGAGFIGSHLVHFLLGSNHTVVVLDDLSSGKISNLPIDHPGLRFIKGSILDRFALSKAILGCKAVIHLAAIASVKASIDHPMSTHQVNFDGTLMLLEASKLEGIERFLFSSSAAVYGDKTEGPISEDSTPAPLTPYAIDKLACEYYINHFHKSFGMEFTIFRFFNIYGPRQDPNSSYSGVISIFSSKAISGDVLDIYGDGEQTRDFVYVKDLVQILSLAIDKKDFFGKTVNIGTGKSISLLKIINTIELILDKPLRKRYFQSRLGDIRYSLADIQRLDILFGDNKPETSIINGLRETIFDVN